MIAEGEDDRISVIPQDISVYLQRDTVCSSFLSF